MQNWELSDTLDAMCQHIPTTIRAGQRLDTITHINELEEETRANFLITYLNERFLAEHQESHNKKDAKNALDLLADEGVNIPESVYKVVK
jgi:hypothetical protein